MPWFASTRLAFAPTLKRASGLSTRLTSKQQFGEVPGEGTKPGGSELAFAALFVFLGFALLRTIATN
jgi:hypothetical protein